MPQLDGDKNADAQDAKEGTTAWQLLRVGLVARAVLVRAALSEEIGVHRQARHDYWARP